MGVVKYRKYNVSDRELKVIVNKIAKKLGDVWVTSGDRGHVPKGGSKTSLHLSHRAIDFGIVGMTLEQGFKKLYEHRLEIFGTKNSYEVIYHGYHTITGGPHLHIGRYFKNTGTKFKMEGTSAKTKGKYTLYDGEPPSAKSARGFIKRGEIKE